MIIVINPMAASSILKWIRANCERAANSGVSWLFYEFLAIGHMRLPDLIKIQCFKNASQLCMLDLFYERMIVGRAPNCFD